MYFPLEIWKEIKDFAGIYSISTEWSLSYIYEGNWVQFYLEWFRPTATEIDQLKNAQCIKEEFFTRAISIELWKRVHLLNHIHQQHKHNAILPILRNCNILLEVEPHVFTQEYDLIEIQIPFSLREKGTEIEIIQSIHSLLDRCHLTRFFYYYKDNYLILTVHI